MKSLPSVLACYVSATFHPTPCKCARESSVRCLKGLNTPSTHLRAGRTVMLLASVWHSNYGHLGSESAEGRLLPLILSPHNSAFQVNDI